MDFAALMGKELSKSKKPASDDSDNKKKFLKRSEVEAERRKAYQAEQAAVEKERETKAAAKRKLEEDTAAEKEARDEKRRKLAEESRRRREDQEWEEEQAKRRRLGLPEQEKPSQNDEGNGVAAADDVPDEELFAKLRELGHPAVLFGETHVGRLRRYKKASTVLTDGPIPTTLKLVDEKDMKVDTVPGGKEEREWLYRQLASYFTMVLSTYKRTLEQERRETSASKIAYNAMLQTIENMKPVSSYTATNPAAPSHASLRKPPANHVGAYSFFENLKLATSTTRSWSPLSRSSRPCRSAATLTPTTATSA